ncbi:MAG: rhodanese-like domain-containing protein [Pseudomonadota bacterium]|nr:rhodanese-like domain-containing protein [Pseudomonadota bacterium]HON39421.1 rhodanese-like domain-containing protein [Deltaproteobacteria bacterium]HPD22536.1 rhodanese-like domain-containing protein [Deltaproteobacteria bacterium]HRS57497.1 rhodanese-like domain-containing protein [Desulfomonilia bacterium]HRV36799.1 rhodanese-like domain-containing protein [Desulfomonilia bacterium]
MNLPSAVITVREALLQAVLILVLSACLGIGVNALRSDRIPLVQDWSLETQMTDDLGNRTDIGLKEAVRLFHEGSAVFLDARPKDEYERGHIRGARSLPFEQADAHVVEALIDTDPGTPIITYCDGPYCTLSHDLAHLLREFGFSDVRVLVNGWSLWKEHGLPVEQGRAPDDPDDNDT